MLGSYWLHDAAPIGPRVRARHEWGTACKQIGVVDYACLFAVSAPDWAYSALLGHRRPKIHRSDVPLET